MDLPLAPEQRAKVEEFQRKNRLVLLTLLFTDIVGSTQLKQELGEVNAVPLLQWHREIVRQTLSRFKEAEEIETAGDSFFLVFAKPSDAVKFALLLQGKLRSSADHVSAPVADRIGIHVGEVFIEEREGGGKARDLYGIQVDACARVTALAKADQILLTRFAFDSARQVLKGQEIEGIGSLSWLNHGLYLLKGLGEAVEVCEVGEGGRAALVVPVDSENGKRQVIAGEELVLGWRPAIDQVVPGTSWVLKEKLGEGGFGEVWLGRHATTKEQRVFKFCFRADRVRALKREVTLFRLLKERVGEHPNMVRLLEVFFDEPPYYLEMEYVAGRDLKTWSEERGGVGAIPLETRLEIVAQVAEALQAAHDAGVIHRDVKPSNILIQSRSSRGDEAHFSNSEIRNPKSEIKSEPPHVGSYEVQTKLTDFGIGQVVSEEALAGLTKSGFTQTMMSPGSSAQTGTQMYMAPELIAGKPASTRSDIYSLGVVLYQLLVRDISCPLTADWTKNVANPLLREDLENCFAGNPQERFSEARQMAANLRTIAKRQRFERWFTGMIPASLAILVGFVLLALPYPNRFVTSSYDLLFNFRNNLAMNDVIIIYMDDFSQEALDINRQTLWDRSLHADLLAYLKSDRAKAVVFDIIFSDPGPNSSADRKLAEAIKAHGKVILGAASVRQPNLPEGPVRVLLPYDLFLDSAAGLGLTQLPVDPDVVVRQNFLESTNLVASLAYAAAELLDSVAAKAARSGSAQSWLNYYGPPGSIPFVSYFKVFRTNQSFRLPPGFFRDKVVFVGRKESGGLISRPLGSPVERHDEFASPYILRASDAFFPGVELQATAFLNLIHKNWLTRLPTFSECLVLGLTGIIFGLGLARCRPAATIPFAILGIFGVGASAYLLFVHRLMWFPWLIIVAGQIPVAGAWSVIYRLRKRHR